MTKGTDRAKIRRISDALHILSKTRDMRILVRTADFKPVGLIVQREQIPDSSIGIMRDWASVYTMDYRMSREPLDMIHPGTGELKKCIVAENAMLVITARTTCDLSDEPENFQWFATPSQMNAFQELLDQINLKDGVISANQGILDGLNVEKDRLFKQVQLLGNENRNLNAQNQRLSVNISALNQRVYQAERNIQLDRKDMITIAAKDAHEIKSASEIGKILGSSADELTDKALEKMAKRNRKLHTYQPDEVIPKQLAEDIREIKKALNLSQIQNPANVVEEEKKAT
jgi:hypothetical protein